MDGLSLNMGYKFVILLFSLFLLDILVRFVTSPPPLIMSTVFNQYMTLKMGTDLAAQEPNLSTPPPALDPAFFKVHLLLN